MKPLVKVPLTYGAVAGFLGGLLVIGLFYIKPHPFLIPVYFDYRIFIFAVFLFFTLKELREVHYSGIFYFWQGLISSLIFVWVFALIASSVIWMFSLIVPEFVQSYVRFSIQQLKGMPQDIIEKVGKEVYDRNLELLPSTNGFDLALLYFGQSFLIGLFISIILSVIFRRQPKT
jgi:hypothetical protein